MRVIARGWLERGMGEECERRTVKGGEVLTETGRKRNEAEERTENTKGRLFPGVVWLNQ